jgi:hypothetical protein
MYAITHLHAEHGTWYWAVPFGKDIEGAFAHPLPLLLRKSMAQATAAINPIKAPAVISPAILRWSESRSIRLQPVSDFGV